jgi:hypothetical protein
MRRWVWVVLMICIAGYAASCSVSSDGGDPVDPVLDRKTPENLIKFFADSYIERDIDRYDESLHDEFLFTFTTEDAELIGLPADEPWWGKTPDVAAANNMFESPDVTKVEMDLPVSSGPWPTEDGLGYRLEPAIKVTVEEAGATEPTTYWVFSSWFDVEIVEDPYDTTLWVFKGIQESLKDPAL